MKKKNRSRSVFILIMVIFLSVLAVLSAVITFIRRRGEDTVYPKDTWGYLITNLQKKFGAGEDIMDEYFTYHSYEDGAEENDKEDIYMKKLTAESASYILSRGISTSSQLCRIFEPAKTQTFRGKDLYMYKYLFQGLLPDDEDSYDGKILSRLKAQCEDISLTCNYYENGEMEGIFSFGDFYDEDESVKTCPLSDIFEADEFYREYILRVFGYGLLDVTFSGKDFGMLCRPQAELSEDYTDRMMKLLEAQRRPRLPDLIKVDVSSGNEFSMSYYEEYFMENYSVPEDITSSVYVRLPELPLLYAGRYLESITDDASDIFLAGSSDGTEYVLCFNTNSCGLVNLPFGFCLDTPLHFFISPGQIKDPAPALRRISGIFPTEGADEFVTSGCLFLRGGGKDRFFILGISCEFYENENGGFDIYIGTVYEEDVK